MKLIQNLRERQNDYNETWISSKMLNHVICAWLQNKKNIYETIE